MASMLSIAILAAIGASTPQPLSVVSSDLNDYNLSIDSAAQTLVVARSEADFRNARILTADRTGDHWSELRPISFSNDRFSDSDPWLTPDGKTLYFISTRPAPARAEGRTDYDIWRAVRTKNGWSEPEHLGPEVNSVGQELGPELHDGLLYFSSARRGGHGGLDIYSARATALGFDPAVALAEPINSSSSDSDFTLSIDGSMALFWRGGNDGGATIYLVRRVNNDWTAPELLPASINLGPFNFTPSFGADGQALYLASTRVRAGQPAGMADIYEVALPN